LIVVNITIRSCGRIETEI